MTGNDAAPEGPRLVAIPTYRDRPARRPQPFDGVDVEGRPIHCSPLSGGACRWLLLVFLSSDCQGCVDLWRGLGDLLLTEDRSISAVIVTHGPRFEACEAVARLAPPDVPVIMSEAAWQVYGVLGAPFYVLIDRNERRVATEGVPVGLGGMAAAIDRARDEATHG